MVILLHIPGCSFGPSAMRANRIDFNDAIQLTERQELLLNIVRLRYNEGPEFLKTNSIASQFRIEMSASADASIGKDQEQRTNLFGFGGSLGYSEQPTISYAPQNDKEFTQQLISPVEIETIVLLVNYGWDIDRVLRLVSDGINGLRNDTIRENAPKRNKDQLREFAEILQELGKLQDLGFVELYFEPEEREISGPISAEKVSLKDIIQADKEHYKLAFNAANNEYRAIKIDQSPVLRFSKQAASAPELARITEKFNLERSLQNYKVLSSPGAQIKVSELQKPLNVMMVSTRSILGVMAYLAQGVAVSAQHSDRGMVPVIDETSLRQGMLPGLFEVKVEKERPSHANLAVPFKNNWFYIDEADISSIRTMGVVNSLMRLKIKATAAQNIPILTIPVGR
jgi:hypothetical protein